MPEPRPPLFLYGPIVTTTPTPETDDRIREHKPASIVGAQLYDHHGRAVAMLSNRPEWTIVTGDLVWSKAYAYDDLFGDADLHYRGHPHYDGDVEPVVVWVDYPDFGNMCCVQAWAWLVTPDKRALVRSLGVEVGSGDWHSPSRRTS